MILVIEGLLTNKIYQINITETTALNSNEPQKKNNELKKIITEIYHAMNSHAHDDGAPHQGG